MKNRDLIINNRDEFIKAYPDKKDLVVDSSLIELLVLFFKIRHDIGIEKIFKKSKKFQDFYDFIKKYYVVTDVKSGIINGVVYFNRDITEKDYESVKGFFTTGNKFVDSMFKAHSDAMQKFIIDNNGELCGNMLYHCSDEQFDSIINSIDFEFTTIRNLLTSIRSDLVNSDRYGKIRLLDKVFFIDISQSLQYNACIGVFSDRLGK